MIDIFVCLILVLVFCFILILLEVIFSIQVIQLEDKLNKGNNWECLGHIHVAPMPNQFTPVQSLSRVQLFAIPWTAAHQASLSITNSQSLPKLVPIESVMSFNHLILCVPISSCLQSFSALGSYTMSQFFRSGGQSIGVSASASVLPINIQD